MTDWLNRKPRVGAPTIMASGNLVLGLFLTVFFFWWPLGAVVRGLGMLRDPATIPEFAFEWHRALSPRIEEWAQRRVASGRASTLATSQVAATEWPVFGSVFYLWATEALQDYRDGAGIRAGEEPPISYARGAIEASAALIVDPGHAKWVIDHWGEDYLSRENVFYRLLIIGGLTSYQRLTGSTRYEILLRDQTNSLAAELDASPVGLLDDYPGESYTVDVLPAYAMIRRADALLGTDHSEELERAKRAFSGGRVDPETELPAYRVDSRTGEAIGPSRGVGVSYMLIWAPELWQDTARVWYPRFEEHFWQEGRFLSGFREFTRSEGEGEWLVEVDTGPVLAGLGTSSSGFGMAAARVHGHSRHAYALGSEALAASWPLPDGSLIGGRLFSSMSDAPFLGESILLFGFTRTGLSRERENVDLSLPLFVPLTLAVLGAGGLLYLMAGVSSYRRHSSPISSVRYPKAQLTTWASLFVLGALAYFASDDPLRVLLVLTLPLLLPRGGATAEGAAAEAARSQSAESPV